MLTKTYLLRDDCGSEESVECSSLNSARARARTWATEGDWDTSHGTVFVSVSVLDTDGDYCDNITVSIDPPEPECSETEHEFDSPYCVVGGIKENPGVWGHGGGVIITTVCRHCGMYRVRDTWAQSPETGEQGLESVSYRDADETSTAWVDSLLEIEYSWSSCLAREGVALIICTAEQGSRTAEATWEVTTDSCDLCEDGSDTDSPLDEDGWPKPPDSELAEARERL